MCHGKERLPGFGKCNPSRLALEKLCAKLLFEHSELILGCGLAKNGSSAAGVMLPSLATLRKTSSRRWSIEGILMLRSSVLFVLLLLENT